MNPEHDITGKVFGIVTVVGYKGSHNRGSMWNCKCSCGKEFSQDGHTLRHVSQSYSCGCTRVAKPRPAKELKDSLVSPLERLRTMVVKRIIHGAIRAGHRFDLAVDQVKEYIDKPCHYCGIVGGNTYGEPMRYARNRARRTYRYNGLDRMDNLLEYTIDNVVPCCRDCNIAKSAKTSADFLAHCERVVAHQKSLHP